MKLLARALLATAVVVGSGGAASAAPPVGCYGLPDVPDAFLCITQFTPGNALPSVDTDGGGTAVTIPRFCAGDCYGPITVPIPGARVVSGEEPAMTFVYKGQEYPITFGEIPEIPEIPETPEVPDTDCGSYWVDYPYYQEVEGIGAYPAACVWFDPSGDVSVQTCAARVSGRRCTSAGTGSVELEGLLEIIACLGSGDDETALRDVVACA